jgi:hypothetical protein
MGSLTIRMYITTSLVLTAAFPAFFGEQIEAFTTSSRNHANDLASQSRSVTYNPSQSLFILHAASVASDTDELAAPTNSEQIIIGSIAFLLPSEGAQTQQSRFGEFSPVPNPSLLDAATHLAQKAKWFSDGRVSTQIATITAGEDILKELYEVDIVIALGLKKPRDLEFAQKLFENRAQRDSKSRFRQCQFCLDCEEAFASTVGPYDQANPSLASMLIPWSDDASGRRFLDQMKGLFDRWTSDDFTVALMLFLNRFSGSAVDWVKDSADATWEKGPIRNAQEFYGMGKTRQWCSFGTLVLRRFQTHPFTFLHQSN